MKKGFAGAVAVLLMAATAAFAGMYMSFKCGTCGLEGKYGKGGGFKFQEMTCFCTGCNQFTSITWSRGAPAPKPVRRDGDLSVYMCPRCKKPTARQWDEKSCPRCGSTEISVKRSGALYD